MRAALGAVLAALLVCGCATTGKSGRGDQLQEVHLFGMPVTLNLDGKPGSDGFAARVYITKPGGVKGAPVRSGAVEVLMFDGVVGADDFASVKPAQSWRFEPAELVRFEERTSLGHGYRFALRWNEAPQHGHITVIARYVPPKGDPMYSSPSTISAGSR